MKLPSRAALGDAFRDLGPLRPVAVWVALVPTIGGIAALLSLSAWVPTAPVAASWWAVAAAGAAAATALVLLPPSVCAFVAGYGLGAVVGGAAGTVGIALGGAVARAWVWPRLGRATFAFMRQRPRALAVRRLCRVGGAARGVALLRLATPFPFAVQNLLFAAARVPVGGVFAGSLLGAAAPAFVAAWCGAAVAVWRQRRELPTAVEWAAGAFVALALVLVGVAARRAWRTAGALGVTSPSRR